MPLSAFSPVSMTVLDTDPARFSKDLCASFRRYGFAVLSDIGLDPELIEAAKRETKAFFDRDDADKRQFHQPGGGGQRGYTPFGIETAKGYSAKDLKEFWHVGRPLPKGHRYERYMPANVSVSPEFDTVSLALFAALDTLGLRVLTAIACDLGLPPNWFDAHVREGNSILRLLHYPPHKDPPPEGSVRAAPHEDINVITLLLGAEEAGLEVKDLDGRWLPINPPAGACVVNIGDMLQRLTNHVLPSTTHRVVNPAPERARFPRYSMPFFLHFQPDVLIETLRGCISAEQANRYPEPITAQAFLEERLREIKLA
jgi:isopenicillin N synthase-like dioxygenase